ncbi:Disease resistance protein [Melia azedarach]|uniref:Disease resistance protein n=1 Tax=Melia azedarach TaxID=155640 RepID=A0ACC1WXY2_MELAZ|nr:Disease resistance protein [Melia azedarach]
MATAAMLQTLTDKIFTGLLNQAQFAIDFRDHFEAMKTKLELMKAFLSSTDNLRSREKDLQNFLPNLRRLIYEADDILTDCLVRDEYQNKSSCWSSSPPGGLLFHYRTGKKLSQINSRIEKMETSIGVYLRPAQQTINQGNCAYRSIAYASQDYDPSDIIGLESDMEKIKAWIFSSNEEINRVGIVGMGGLGKTTIAQKIFNDKDMGARFEKRIWLSASQNFSEDRIMRAMLRQLGHDDSTLDESHLLHKIHQILGDKSCLIVMDDVWRINLDWWNKLCPTSENSFVVITSRDVEVTMSMGVDIARIHRPRTLNEEESWSLFSKYAFSTRKGKCPNDQFERVGRDVLEKCGGLPLAIKTIGALLAQKLYSLAEWKKINEDFHQLTTERNNSEVMASLQLSYDELPSLLKQCLLCFSIYPEDFEISGEQIVHWWVGEGLIQGQDTKTAAELGFQYLSDLVSRCLVEVVHRRGYDGRVYSCKMHDLVRDMTIKIAKDEAFCSFDEQGRQKLREDSRWLGFTNDIDPKSLKISSKLRAFLLMSSATVSLDRNVELLMSLRVLDFSYIKLDTIRVEDLLNWICSLKRLASLNLSGLPGLKEVPSSVQKLRNLQILVLRKCNNLAKIQPSITNLKKLIVLDLGSCALMYLPHGLGKLVLLQELSGYRVVSRANTQSSQFLELLNLKQLRVLRMNINNECEISENEWTILSRLEKLKVLAIDAEDCKDKRVAEMLDQLSPPPRLEELYLRRYRHETLPKWMNPKQLSNLQYLCLEDGDIINFETSSESLDSNGGSKWILEGLCLKFMPNLVLDWQILQKDIPFLCYAEISRCFNLKNFPYPSDKPIVWRKNQD